MTPSRTALLLAPLLAFAACNNAPAAAGPAPAVPAASTSASPAAPGSIAVGATPPDFNVTASDGTAVHLAALKGKPVVVYFYPKDETPGCTTEACSFRDAWNALQAKGVVLIGVSADSDESHRGFAKNHQLPFLLVSDPKGTIAAQFGVPMKGSVIMRQSFLIGADGKMKKIYREVDVAGHAAQIMADLQ
jgi:peroxiredoxin Q/BCP